MKMSKSSSTKVPDEDRAERMLHSVTVFFKCKKESMYTQAFDMWNQILKFEEKSLKLKPQTVEFVFTYMLPTVLHKDPVIRGKALKAVKDTLPLLLQSDYRSNPAYQSFLKNSIADHMPKLKNEIDSNTDWPTIWCYYLTVIQKDMVRSTQINTFLSVAEQGFRSSNSDVRTKSFQCWQKLMEIFANEGQLQAPKRLKLIVLPLVATASRNVELATAKFSCWWYLINNVSTENCEDIQMCFLPFLNFCFGPLNDTPLSSYASPAQALSPGKLYEQMRLPVIVALIKVLGEAYPVVYELKMNMELEMKMQMDIGKVFAKSRRELVHCCAEATVLIYSAYTVTARQQGALIRNVWQNLFALFKQDDQLTKSIILTMGALKALVQLCSDKERKAIRPAVQIVFETLAGANFHLKKGAEFQIDYGRQMLEGLIYAAPLMDKAESKANLFKKFITDNFNGMILADNRANFVNVLGKVLIEDVPTECDFPMWCMVWDMVIKLDKIHPMQLQLIQFGLEKFFNNMIEEKELWIGATTDLNAYLNQVAKIFHKVSADKPASFHVVEVVTKFLDLVDKKYTATNAPKDVFVLFNAWLERFLATEFLDTFLDSLNNFLQDLTRDRFVMIMKDFTDTLRVLDQCSKSMVSSAAIVKLRKSLTDKCANAVECDAFKASNGKWFGQPAAVAAKKKDDDAFVPIQRDWHFNPKDLTEHQIERMKQHRDDIPALYNDNSVSQDSRSLQPWSPRSTTNGVSRKSSVIVPAPTSNAANTAQEPPTKSVFSTPAPVSDSDDSSSRPSTPQNKKRNRVQTELSRLTIDTVEGHNMLNDGKKMRNSRRHSVDTRMTAETRTSPRKGGVEPPAKEVRKTDKLNNMKPRRSPLTVDVKKERTNNKPLEPVPESTIVDTLQKIEVPTAQSKIVKDSTHVEKADDKARQVIVQSVPVQSSSKPEVAQTEVVAAVEKLKDPEIQEAVEVMDTETTTPAEAIPDPVQSDVQPMETEASLGTDLQLVLESANNSENPTRSIVSSPELDDVEDRESTFLNDTINISPILKDAAAPKDTAPAPTVAKETQKVGEPKTQAPEILTTPKRCAEPTLKENHQPTAISTTPHSFLSKMNGRGAQMLQQTKLFQESTPKAKDEPQPPPTVHKEDTLQRMLINCKSGVPAKSSPSTSILRRKRLEESMDDTMESPAAKKKKVSFSDPPVSATKEFERDSNGKLSRPMVSFKHKLNRLLIRKSRTDSASEIHSLDLENGASSSESEEDMEEASTSDRPRSFLQDDDHKIFEYLQKKYVEPAESGGDKPILAISQTRALTDVLLHGIIDNEPARELFFRTLTCAMPKETLQWSLKENPGYTSLTEARKEIAPATFNHFVLNLLRTDKEFAKQLRSDMQLRLDPLEKLEFISALSSSKPQDQA